MKVSSPREPGSGARIPPFLPSSSSQAKRTGLLFLYSILSSIYQTQITAQNAIPAQKCNTIYSTTSPFAQSPHHYIYIRVCCMSVSARSRHCWLRFSNIPLTPVSLLQIAKRNVFFCYVFSYVVPLDDPSYYYQHTQASGLRFYPVITAGVRILSVSENSAVISIQVWCITNSTWARGRRPAALDPPLLACLILRRS